MILAVVVVVFSDMGGGVIWVVVVFIDIGGGGVQ